MPQLSQDDLAAAVGVARPTVTNWENGKHLPTPGNMQDIARALGLTVDAIEARATELEQSARPGVVRESAVPYGAPARPSAPRIPPRAYALIYEHVSAMEREGVPEEMIDEARRLMGGETFNALNMRTYVPRDEDGWIKDIEASWALISDVLREGGFKV